MRSRIAVLLLLCSAILVAQSTPKAEPGPAQGDTKASCVCCQKMVDTNGTPSCCAHRTSKDAQTASCCGDKAAMACMKDGKDKSADACCGTGKCGGKDDQKGCCGKSAKTSEQASMACCGGSSGQCGMHHDHSDMAK